MSYFMKDSIKTHAVSPNRNNAYADLARRVKSGEFKIAVYGLGHVGSPLASTCFSWRSSDRRRQLV